MAVGETLPHCTGTGTSADPYKYSTAEGFNEAIAVVDAYVEAAEENLIFDVNDGIVSNPIVQTCYSLNGKGTTILNLYRTSSGSLINFATNNKSYSMSNMNFYNMMIVNNSSAGIRFINWGNGDDYVRHFYNCNFSGIIRGSSIYSDTGIIVTASNNYTRSDQGMHNCTFNFNIQGTLTNVSKPLFYAWDNNFYLNNCTVCISGNVGTANLRIAGGWCFNNCTIANSSTNPLICSGDRTIYLESNVAANYNYIKMYIENDGNSTLVLGGYASKTLVNRSRLPANMTISGTCISMQETDPTASDYIYNAENLADAGFLVGTVIE